MGRGRGRPSAFRRRLLRRRGQPVRPDVLPRPGAGDPRDAPQRESRTAESRWPSWMHCNAHGPTRSSSISWVDELVRPPPTPCGLRSCWARAPGSEACSSRQERERSRSTPSTAPPSTRTPVGRGRSRNPLNWEMFSPAKVQKGACKRALRPRRVSLSLRPRAGRPTLPTMTRPRSYSRRGGDALIWLPSVSESACLDAGDLLRGCGDRRRSRRPSDAAASFPTRAATTSQRTPSQTR